MYGYIPDLPDHRDFSFLPRLLHAIPPRIDLSACCPPVYDQGQLGSCTANAIGAAIEFDQMKEGLTPFVPSRLFVYYNERLIERTVLSDCGAQIRNGIKSVARQGACPETLWPYEVARFADRPSDACYEAAREHKVVAYHRVTQDLLHLKSCLAEGYPFVFGFTVYTAFESEMVASTGHLQLPGANESVVGGHAVLAVGYDDANQSFLVRNSWGTEWGLPESPGYFTMPYAYVLHQRLATDFWTLRTVQ